MRKLKYTIGIILISFSALAFVVGFTLLFHFGGLSWLASIGVTVGIIIIAMLIFGWMLLIDWLLS